MMPAAKMLDPILGIDLHLIQPPAGPPLLLPHPGIGIAFDPFDLIPKIGANVFVNGLPRVRAGNFGLMLPHFPIGGTFVMPPRNDLEIFMGSKTVSADEEAFSYLAMPVLACQSVGMPPIPRPKLKKPKAALGLVLPTAVVLAIPCGVFVDGPPTISLMALVFRAGLGALGKLARRAKNTRPWRALSNRARNWADKLAHRLKLGDVARNRVRRGACTVTGHPVDVATGKLFTDSIDLELPGPLPFVLERVWYSTSTYAGPLGHGWHHNFDTALYVTPELILHRTSDGRVVAYPPLEAGEHYFDRDERCTLHRDERSYRMETANGLIFEFALVSATNLGSSSVHRLARISNRAGHRIELRYSERGTLREIIDSAGRSIAFESDREGRLVSVSLPHPEDPEQRLVALRYAYDELGNLSARIDALGHAFSYRYDGHLLVKETDRAGTSFYFQFDGRDETARCIRTWGDGGIYDRQITYQPGVTTVVDSLGGVTRYEHANGLVTRSTDPLGATRESRYEHAQLVEWVDPLGRRTRCSYDARGNPTELVRADGVKLTTRYDERGLPIEQRDALGGIWKWRYDDWGQVVERIDPLGASTRFSYERGFLLRTQDALGNCASFGYDAHGNLAQVIAPDGTSKRFACNVLGWPIEIGDGVGNVQRRSYDLAGMLRRVEDIDGNVSEFDYDGEGRLLRIADRWGEARLSYCGTGRVDTCTRAGLSLQFSYDGEERLRAIVNEHGAVHSFERDAAGEVAVERCFDGVTHVYTRDALGRTLRVEHSGGRSNDYEYDALDRIVRVRYSDGSEERYSYRADGVLTSAALGDVCVKFEHDALGQVVREVQGEHWVEREYDALGRRTRLKSSLGLDQRIERDALGRVLALQIATADAEAAEFEVRFARDALGAEIERTLPGDLRLRWQRDAIARPLRQQVFASEQRRHERSYQWSVGARLLEREDATSGSVSYAYDALGQLAAARYAGDRIEYRLPDAVGNLFKHPERADRRYAAAGQVLEAAHAESGVVSYAYDSEGARSEKRAADGARSRYLWNGQARLREVLRPDGASTRFEYDALGRRVAKHHGARVTRWVWDEDVPIHEWVEENERAEPSVTWLFEPESHVLMARVQGSVCDSAISDPFGTPLALFDRSGEATFRAELDIWGAPRIDAGSRERCPFRWAGQYEDVETGLYYNRFRYYDPETGQYLSHDPIGLGGGLSLYGYVANPIMQSDPLGLAGTIENVYPEDVPGSRYGVVQLEQRNGVWYEMYDGTPGRRARGLYDFVVIDGKVYAAPLGGNTKIGHVSIANGASVEYAGEVRFGKNTSTRGIVSAWNNGSGHFLPHPGWAHQAPFPHELFTAADFDLGRGPTSIRGPQLPIIGHSHGAGCRAG